MTTGQGIVTVIGMPNDCPEDHHSRDIWKAHDEALRIALRMNGITAVDTVFSSEEYGEELAEHVLVGAESTGTSTLAEALTEHYRNRYPDLIDVPEFGRQYTYDKLAALQATSPDAVISDLARTSEDFTIIGERQNEMEDEAAARYPLVLVDATSIATSLFERICIGEHSHGSYRAVEQLPATPGSSSRATTNGA